MYLGDATYILVIIGAVICLIASARVKTTFNKYSKYRSATGLTGAQAAEKMLHDSGIYDVQVRRISGQLTDNYNPKDKTLNLSEVVYDKDSVAAIGVACHECGHAIQHQVGYSPMHMRSALVPLANIGQVASWPLIIVGILLSSFISPNSGYAIIQLGIIMFSLAVLFQLVTLPVEFNASRRALNKIEELGFLSAEELPMTKKVLKSAAMTYVASAAAAILQLLRLLLIFGKRND